MDFIDKQAARGFVPGSDVPQRRLIIRVLKRFMDVFVSALGLLLLSPLFLYISIRIKCESPGSIFYRGDRVGRNGVLFKILKFRTMYENHEKDNGLPLTIKNDQRVTPYGNRLRESKLNELPNLWNVLVGEMSLVGPRPEDPAFVEAWPEDVKAEVLSMRPGITSPASIIFRDEEALLGGNSVMDDYLRSILPEKLRLDQLYVRYYNFFGDWDVLLMTFVMLIPGVRKQEVQEGLLFDGPLVSFGRSYFSWFVLDALVAFIAISGAVLIWRIQEPLEIGFWRMVLLALGLAFTIALTNSILGLKKISWRYASPTHVFDIALSTFLALGLFVLVSHIFPSINLPISLVINIGIFAFAGFVLVRYRELLLSGLAARWTRWRSQSSLISERVLIIGAGDAAQLAIWLMEKSDLHPLFSIVGMVDDDYRKQRRTITEYPVLGTTRDIPEIVKAKSIGLILFSIARISQQDRERILNTCKALGVRVILIPELMKVMNDYLSQQTKEVSEAHD